MGTPVVRQLFYYEIPIKCVLCGALMFVLDESLPDATSYLPPVIKMQHPINGCRISDTRWTVQLPGILAEQLL